MDTNMIFNFYLVCKECAHNTQDANKSTRCSIHQEPDHFEFMCYNCGKKEVFKPDTVGVPTAGEQYRGRVKDKRAQEVYNSLRQLL